MCSVRVWVGVGVCVVCCICVFDKACRWAGMCLSLCLCVCGCVCCCVGVCVCVVVCVCVQGFSCIEKMWARAYAVFPSAYNKSQAPKAKKNSAIKKINKKKLSFMAQFSLMVF